MRKNWKKRKRERNKELQWSSSEFTIALSTFSTPHCNSGQFQIKMETGGYRKRDTERVCVCVYERDVKVSRWTSTCHHHQVQLTGWVRRLDCWLVGWLGVTAGGQLWSVTVVAGTELSVVLGWIHAQDVGNDTINMYGSDERGEEELLHETRLQRSQRR